MARCRHGLKGGFISMSVNLVCRMAFYFKRPLLLILVLLSASCVAATPEGISTRKLRICLFDFRDCKLLTVFFCEQEML